MKEEGLHQDGFRGLANPMTIVEEFLLHDAVGIDDISAREGHAVGAAARLRIRITDAVGFDDVGVRICERGKAESAHPICETLQDLDRVVADRDDAQAVGGEFV